MHEKKGRAVCVILLNLLALGCLIWFAVMYLSHDSYVPNPDAMLPMAKWEGGGMALTLGLVPMLIANTLGYRYILREDKPLWQRLLPYLMGLFELVLVISYWAPAIIETVTE
jgi:hypothetical protein